MSLWMTCARSAGSAGSARSMKRSSTRSSCRRRSGSSTSDAWRTRSGRCFWSHSIARPAAGWKKPRSATPMRAHTRPIPRIAPASSSPGAAVRPGRNGKQPHQVLSGAIREAAEGLALSVGRARGTGRSGSIRATCSTAATSMATTAGSSAAFETFSTQRAPSASSSRKFWSRSLTSGRVETGSTPNRDRAASTARPASRVGGSACRTPAVFIGADATRRYTRLPCPRPRRSPTSPPPPARWQPPAQSCASGTCWPSTCAACRATTSRWPPPSSPAVRCPAPRTGWAWAGCSRARRWPPPPAPMPPP